MVLGRAFEVLTMERFSYWATLLALPFVGLLATELIDRFRMPAVIGLTMAARLTCALAVAWAAYRPADAVDFKVDSTAAWLNRDGHDKYRYVTLGFGNKISRLAVLTDASSVDGEWNSGRMLPELTQHGAGALTSSKYFGKSGIDALNAILHHADRYGLKWVFLRDPYYEPLLVFAGWRKVDDLEDRTISVWSKEDVPPATPINAPQIPPHWQGLLWGILPIGSSILAMLLMLIPEKRCGESAGGRARLDPRRLCSREDDLVTSGRLLAFVIALATVAFIVVGTALAGSIRTRHGWSRFRGRSAAPFVVTAGSGRESGGGDRPARLGHGLLAISLTRMNSRKRILCATWPEVTPAFAVTQASIASTSGRSMLLPTKRRFELNLRWSTVVGTFLDTPRPAGHKDGRPLGSGVAIVKEPHVPPQVIPVNYLRWDVIYRGAEDDWGAQDVESPHVRIVDMHPVERGGGVVVMGELLNEDVVPAFVTVKATSVGERRVCDRDRRQLRQDFSRSLAQASDAISHRVSQCRVVAGGQRSHAAVIDPDCGVGRSGDRN